MNKDKKKKYEPPVPTRVGKKKKKTKGPDAASKLPLGKCSSAKQPCTLSALPPRSGSVSITGGRMEGHV